MLKLHSVKGKTIREWAEADLPYGAFTKMVQEIDPVYGIYAEAGAKKKSYRVLEDGEEVAVVEAYYERHAELIARHDLRLDYYGPFCSLEVELIEQ